MVSAIIDGVRTPVSGWSYSDKPPFNHNDISAEKLANGQYKFLCPDCQCDEFSSVSEAIGECDNCSTRIAFSWA